MDQASDQESFLEKNKRFWWRIIPVIFLILKILFDWGSSIRLFGGLFVGWGLLDVFLSKIDIDLYGNLGLIIPDFLWHTAHWIAMGVGAVMIAIGRYIGSPKGENTETE